MAGNSNIPVRVAVLENSHIGVVAQMKKHEDADEDRFDRMFKFISIMKSEILESVGALDDKLTEKISDLDKKFDQRIGTMDEGMTEKISDLNQKIEDTSERRLEPLEQDNKLLLADMNQRKGAFKVSGFLLHLLIGICSAGGGAGIVIGAHKFFN